LTAAGLIFDCYRSFSMDELMRDCEASKKKFKTAHLGMVTDCHRSEGFGYCSFVIASSLVYSAHSTSSLF
jgi:hypothetical protein